MRHMFQFAAAALALVPMQALANSPQIGARLDAVIAKAQAEHPEVPSISLSVWSPKSDLSWDSVAGSVAFGGEKVTEPRSFRIASVTKVFVATAVLRLVEQGKVELAGPISAYASPETIALLRADGYDPDAILVRHLLEHSGGIADYAMMPAFLEKIFANTKHRWSRTEQVRFAMDNGEPLGKPGAAYQYSDTGYIILGEIIERASGQPMAKAVRELGKFEALGLTSTWFETLEPVPAKAAPRVHQYLQKTDINEWDPSFDLYGGGGLISTTPDLAKFFRAILTGGVFEKPETLAIALATPYLANTSGRIQHAPLLPTAQLGKHQCWGHGGFFGTMAIYCPDIDTAITLSVNMNSGGRNDTMREILQGTIDALDAVKFK